MGRENRLAADIFASILPWIDRDHQVVFLQDEGGQNQNAVPDLCFQFLGSLNGPIRIEFKVVKLTKQGGSVALTANQVKDWRSNSSFSDMPHCWIGVDYGGAKYYFWEHDAIAPLIQQAHTANGNGGYRTVRVPARAESFGQLLSVFRVLLEFAERHKLCP